MLYTLKNILVMKTSGRVIQITLHITLHSTLQTITIWITALTQLRPYYLFFNLRKCVK